MSRRTGIMLCYPFEEKRLLKWNLPVIVQPKFNGDRCRAIIKNGTVTLLSSEAIEILGAPHVNNLLSKHNLDIELDGELYRHGMLHQDIHSIVSRKVNLHPEHSVMRYHVFDVVSQSTPQVNRIQLLHKLPIFNNTIQKVPFVLANTVDDIMRIMDEYIQQGYEGVVVRELTAPYVRKRSTSVMKYKPHQEDAYEIIDFVQEVSKDGIKKEMIGAVQCVDDMGTKFKVGFTTEHDLKHYWWVNREELIGKWLEVRYQAKTRDKVPYHARPI